MSRYNILSVPQEKYWICTDIDTGIFCEFQEQNFHYTHQFYLLEYSITPIEDLGDFAHKMIEWLKANHLEKLS